MRRRRLCLTLPAVEEEEEGGSPFTTTPACLPETPYAYLLTF